MTARQVSHQPRSGPKAKHLSAGGITPGDTQPPVESQRAPGVATPPPETGSIARTVAAGEFLDLRIWAESYADMQQARIALVNRMERGGIDAALLQGHRELLDASENAFRLAMVRSYRRIVRQHMPAVEEWQKAHFGIGEHLLARLLGHLGHPVIAEPYQWMDDAPDGHVCIPERCGVRHLVALEPYERSLRQLWTYCGHGAPVRRRKGMSQDDALGLGSSRCKMLVHLLAEATIKCRPEPTTNPEARAGSVRVDASPLTGDRKFHYRRVYDARKASTVDRGWTDGHRHADALRIVGKEILRDLWTTARAQDSADSQGSPGAGGAGGDR